MSRIQRSIGQGEWNQLNERLAAVENGLATLIKRVNGIHEDQTALGEAGYDIAQDVELLITRVDDIHTTVDGITQADQGR